MSVLGQRLRRLPLERRVKFLDLLRSEGTEASLDRPTPRPRDDTAPLSFSQNLLWFLDRLTPGVPAYNLVIAFWLDGDLDVAALRTALETVVARHETLRTSLREFPDGPKQFIAAEMSVPLRVTPIDGADLDERRAKAREAAVELLRRPFDLSEGPLWRTGLFQVAPTGYLFAFVVHHVIFDGASSEAFTGELLEAYRAATEGRDPVLTDLPIQYADFAIWQREILRGKRLDRLVEFWRDRLRDAPVLEIPTDHPRPAEFSYRGADAERPIPARAIAGVHELARELGVTPYPVYVAVFVEMLRRYTGQEDLVVGCSTSVRDRLEVQDLIGFFVNMLALRVDADRDRTFRDLVKRTDAVLRESFAHVDLPFERVVQAVAPVRDPSRSPLVQVAFLMPTQPWTVELPGLEVDFEQLVADYTKFDMTWQVTEAGEESTLAVEYSTDLWDADTLDAMIGHYNGLLTSLIDEPDRAVGEVEMLSPDERAELIERWNGARTPVTEGTVHECFARRAAETPDAIAVVAGDETIGYAELDRRANRLAWLLRSHGAEPGRLVALSLPRGVDHVIAVLATLKAGAAFVPLDPGFPPDRTAALLRDADPCAVLVHGDAATDLPGGPPVLALDRLGDDLAGRPDHAPPPAAGPADLAYALYTSGSTGTPKGVLIEHHSVMAFIDAVRDLFELTPADHVLGYAAYTFDVSVFEMFAALLVGGRLHIAADADRLDIDRLQRLLEDGRISVIDMPPAVMALLDPSRLTDLRISFVGGEAFPGDLVNRWNRVSRFFNGYGPTECTVTMIVQECAGHWEGSPPIGLPIANHVAHVLDENLQPVPYGVPGELVIGGAGLARGYLNEPELTREKFVSDPFGTAPDGRLYRTGDLVKRRRDGAIVFLGRVDRQVKIRGIRIEPGEVEAVLADHPQVRQVHVTAWQDPRGQRHLVAYAAIGIETAVTPQELRNAVAAKLPATMVPQYVVVLPELPLTSSGKIDARSLPAPDQVQRANRTITAPRTEVERILAEELLGPVLQTDAVDVKANFFEIGGSSLQAAQVISGIRRRFGIEITVADFFRDPTIEGLAVLVERRRAASLDDDELLDVIEQMSEEEVERIAAHERGEVGR